MMSLPFVKMQGAGNDYVYFDCVSYPELSDLNWPELAVRFSDRHFGIGGDGVVLIMPSATCDFRMRIFNADGSEAQMCGNASRCIGRYVFEKHLTEKTDITLETLSGTKYIHIDNLITVGMGQAKDIHTIEVENRAGISVNMGNPHAVFFVDSITDQLVLVDGKRYETNPIFPERSNIEFARVVDAHTVQMRVWERGSGETLACGTGACATAVAAIHSKLCQSPVTIELIGGKLVIDVDNQMNVKKTGPAELVFEGMIKL